MNWIGLYLGVGYCKGSGFVRRSFFLFFLWENADPGEKQDPRSDGIWWKGYSRGRSW